MVELTVGPYTVSGISIGGVKTSIHIAELGVLLDVGAASFRNAHADHVFLSHGHGDHASCLASWLGIRQLIHRQKDPPRIYAPAEIVDDVHALVEAGSRLYRHPLRAEIVAVAPGDEIQLKRSRWVRAFRTHHPVPSLGYQFVERVEKLKPEFLEMDGREIARRRSAGEVVVEPTDRLEVAYATDTISDVLSTAPEILKSRVLILECTFLDSRRSVEETRQRGHIHLDELLERVSTFDNEHVVLMHFSLSYSPDEVRALLARQCPPEFLSRIHVFAPSAGQWPG